MNHFGKIIVARDRLFLVVLFLCLLVTVNIVVHLLERWSPRETETFILPLGPTGDILGQGQPKRLSELTNVCLLQLTLATDALFIRNADGFRRPVLLEQMFSPEMISKAQRLSKTEEDNFKRYFLTQTPELESVTILKSDSEFFKVRAQGKLIRHGSYNGQTIPNIPLVPFTMEMTLRFDPMRALRFATLLYVQDFDYELPSH
jgi:hypothetical protein